MRRVLVILGLTLAFGSFEAQPAAAFGDKCFYPGITAKGSPQSSMSAAYSSARSAWESRAAKKYGRRSADWWYSGDREFSCTWNTSGSRISCTAYAVACGRK
jgi:hypothetical protein